MTIPSAQPAASAPDLAGSRFLGSAGVALLVASWGALCGSWVETAATSCPQAMAGALLAALLLAGCGAALALVEAAHLGVREALGRALREALRSSWQGAWLGGLIGGACATGGGAGLLLLVVIVAALGGALGLFLGRLGRVEGRISRVKLGLALALLGSFVVAACWAAPGTPTLPGLAPVDVLQASPVFGPGAAWFWQVSAAAPFVVGVLVVGIWSCWSEPAAAGEQTLSRTWQVAAILFVAALAAGLGAVVGAAIQWLVAQLALGTLLTPTLGKWLGATLALVLWSAGRQPDQGAVVPALRQRLAGALSSLLPEPQTSDDSSSVLSETR